MSIASYDHGGSAFSRFTRTHTSTGNRKAEFLLKFHSLGSHTVACEPCGAHERILFSFSLQAFPLTGGGDGGRRANQPVRGAGCPRCNDGNNARSEDVAVNVNVKVSVVVAATAAVVFRRRSLLACSGKKPQVCQFRPMSSAYIAETSPCLDFRIASGEILGL